jgi:hypothetical protein
MPRIACWASEFGTEGRACKVVEWLMELVLVKRGGAVHL